MALKLLDILVLGKSGNGKSKAGNSILKKKEFQTSGSTKSETSELNFGWSEYKNYTIQVVDTPGYGDTRLESRSKVEEFSKHITHAMKANDGQGYHVILQVMKYGNRLTEEEKDSFNGVNRIFPGVMSNHGILLITGGDTFKKEHRESGITFEQWCQDQDNDFQELLREFGGRAVLFNNFAEDEAEQDAQLDRLLEMIESLPSDGKRYSNVLFMAGAAELNNSSTESGEDNIDVSLMSSTSALVDHFDRCRRLETQIGGSNETVSLTEWRKLLLRCDTLTESLESGGGEEIAVLKKRLVTVKIAIVSYIEIKETRNGDSSGKFAELQAAMGSIRDGFRKVKAKKIFIIVGLVVGAALGLACIIAMLIWCPASLLWVMRLSWALAKFKFPIKISLITITSVVTTILVSRNVLKSESQKRKML